MVKFGNIRIGGRPGSPEFTNLEINTNWAILKGHLNYNESHDIHAIYHAACMCVNIYDVHKLMQVEEPVDVFLSHARTTGPLASLTTGTVKS